MRTGASGITTKPTPIPSFWRGADAAGDLDLVCAWFCELSSEQKYFGNGLVALRRTRVSGWRRKLIAANFGINPPGFMGELAAFAFTLATGYLFPAINHGRFPEAYDSGRCSQRHGVRHPLHRRLIIWLKFIHPELNTSANGWFWHLALGHRFAC